MSAADDRAKVELMVCDSKGRFMVRDSERNLHRLRNGRPGVVIGDRVREVALLRVPGRNLPVAFVDQRLPGHDEPRHVQPHALWDEADRDWFAAAPQAPAHVSRIWAQRMSA